MSGFLGFCSMVAPIAVVTANAPSAMAKTQTKSKKTNVIEEWVYTPKQYDRILHPTPQEVSQYHNNQLVAIYQGDEATQHLQQVFAQAKQYYLSIGAKDAATATDTIWQQRESDYHGFSVTCQNGAYTVYGRDLTINSKGQVNPVVLTNGPIIFD